MKGVLQLLEIEVADQLNMSGIAGVPVLPGQSDGTRPDQYVSVVVTDAQERGSAKLCTLQIRVVGPVFGILDQLQDRLAAVYAWAVADESPLNAYDANGLQIFGSSFPDLSSEVSEAQRAEVIEFKVGAYAETLDIIITPGG